MQAVEDRLVVMWGRAKLSWTPSGQRLSVELALDQRASALFGERVSEALRSFDELRSCDAQLQFQPGHVARSSTRTEAEWAVLTVVAPHLFGIDPAELRSTLNELAEGCRLDAIAEQARDEEIGTRWFAHLRSGTAS